MLLFLPGGVHKNLGVKAAAVVLYLATFMVVSWPITSKVYTSGGCQWHVTLLGLQSPFDNVLRVLVGEKTSAVESTLVSVIEANIDDSSPQVLGYAMERLLEAGALDASLSPLQMKKNRPGSLLRVITKPELQEQLADIIFSRSEEHTSELQSH